MICCAATTLSLYSNFYFNEKQILKSRSYFIQIFVLSILTVMLMIVNNSISNDDINRNAKVKSILNNYWTDREFNSHFWNTLQSTYKCCGVNGSGDWKPCVPLSCYQTQSTWLQTWKQTVSCPYPHENGCYNVIVKYLDEIMGWFKIIGLVFVSLGVFEIVGMLLTLFLSSIIFQKKNQTNLPVRKV